MLKTRLLMKRFALFLSALLCASLISFPVCAKDASALTTQATPAPVYLTPFFDLEADAFSANQPITASLRDYVHGLVTEKQDRGMTLKTVSDTKTPGVSSKKALACTITATKESDERRYGIFFSGGQAIGTFSSFSEHGNLSDDTLKNSGIAFYLDLSDYSDALELQPRLAESDCTVAGAKNGETTFFSLRADTATLNAIYPTGQAVRLNTNNTSIEIPAKFTGWITIPFAKLQRERFDSTDENTAFDLVRIQSFCLSFPVSGKASGSFLIDEISFYGPYFKSDSEKSRPKQDTSLAAQVKTDSAENLYYEEFTSTAQAAAGKETGQSTSQKRFSEKYPVFLWILFSLGLLLLILLSVQIVRQNFLP